MYQDSHLAMFKFTLNFLKINWSLRDIFILCKQVSELKENIVISMSLMILCSVFLCQLRGVHHGINITPSSIFTTAHSWLNRFVPLLAKLFIDFVEYYISRRPSARPLKTTYRPSCSRIHITKDTRKYFNLHTKKPLINLFLFSFNHFFFHFFLFSIISSLTEAPKRKQFLGMMHRPFLEAVQLNHILWFWKTKCL